MAAREASAQGGRAYVVLLAGGIASGKSTVARLLEEHGAQRIDLDALSREATAAGSEVVARIADAFGPEVVDEAGALRRAELARRAFATPVATRALEAIVHPAVRDLLEGRLSQADAGRPCVVEVPLLDRVEYLLPLADEVLCVTCPLELRRRRAVLRGMTEDDFDARVGRQPTEAYLVAHATTVFVNDEDEEALRARVAAWWEAHGWEWGE